MNATSVAMRGVNLAPVVTKVGARLHHVSRSTEVRNASRRVGEAVGEVWGRFRDLQGAITKAWRSADY